VVSVTPRAYFTPGKDKVPIAQEAGWATGPVWRGAKNLAPTGIRSPDRPARSSVAIPTELPAHKRGGSSVTKLQVQLLHWSVKYDHLVNIQ
jgi:hypothetical protein